MMSLNKYEFLKIKIKLSKMLLHIEPLLYSNNCSTTLKLCKQKLKNIY